MVLQGVDFPRDLFDAVKRHDADFGVFQRHRVAGVVIIDDAVEPDHLAGHLEAGHLVPAILGSNAGLEEACADGVQGGELLAVAEKRGATLDLAAHGNNFLDPVQFLRVQPHGHAQFPQIAAGTCDFDGLDVHACDLGSMGEATAHAVLQGLPVVEQRLF